MRPEKLSLSWMYAITAATVAVLLFAIWGYIHVVSQDTRSIQNDWVHYNKDAVQRTVLLDQLRDVIGYGGYIHNFKNFVIRGEDAYRDQVERYAAKLDEIITRYRDLDLSDEEQDAIDVIEATFDEYAISFEIAKEQIAKSSPSKYIDKLVRVNDAYALEALKKLSTISITKSMVQRRSTAVSLEKDLASIQYGYLLVPLVVGVAIVFLLLIRRQYLMNAQLEVAKIKAEDATKAKSAFLASMSHELRTPLNAVVGFSDALTSGLGEGDPEKQKEYLGYISTAGKQLNDLIGVVLDFSKIEEGKVDLSPEWVLPADVFRECLPIIENLSKERGVSFKGVREANSRIFVDPVVLRQVLLNFITNAIKYNVPGGEVEFGCKPLNDGQIIRVYVSDTGIGIPESELGRVFQPFDRLRLNDADVSGAGLGLSISKKLAEAMGGKIEFESVSGTGSTFWVDFPTEASMH